MVAIYDQYDYIEEQRDGGKYSGTSTLTITSPADFWRSSKFLVIIMEGASKQVAREAQLTAEDRSASR